MKLLIVTFSMFLSFNLLAQNDFGTIILKNGKEFKGLVSVEGSKVTFRSNKGAEKVKFKGEEIEKVVFKLDDNKIETYVYILLKENAKKLSLVEVLVMPNNENQVALFQIGNSRISSAPGGYGYGMSSRSTTSYYVKKGNDAYAEKLFETGNIGYSFKNRAREFFADCPRLVKKINNKEFKKRDIEKVVMFYNQSCN